VSNNVPPANKSARNEQRKLRANSWNAIGLAFVAIGFVQPLVLGELNWVAVVKLATAALIGYILHRHAIWLLSQLEE
jgi:hypothetical protein